MTKRFLGGKVASSQDFYLNDNLSEQSSLNDLIVEKVLKPTSRTLFHYAAKCDCVCGASVKTVISQLRFMAKELEEEFEAGIIVNSVKYSLEIKEVGKA